MGAVRPPQKVGSYLGSDRDARRPLAAQRQSYLYLALEVPKMKPAEVHCFLDRRDLAVQTLCPL